MSPSPNYDKAIADGARAYITALRDYALARTKATMQVVAASRDCLFYMVDAEKHGWNPEEYESEEL